MMLRLLLILALLATPALAQSRSLFGPPKPKVVATPPPPVAKPVEAKPVRKSKPKVAPKAKDPLAPYMATVKAAFAARWAEAATPVVQDFTPGSASVLFKLDAEGAVTAVTMTDNTSNEAFAAFCEKFVKETVFEKPPGNALTDGQVEIPFTFKVY